MLVFVEGGKSGEPGEEPQSKDKNQQQINSAHTWKDRRDRELEYYCIDLGNPKNAAFSE